MHIAQKQKEKKNPTFIDLFCGCGGLSLGFEDAGYRSLIAIDSWSDALATYSHNRSSANTLLYDLSDIKVEELKKHIPDEIPDVIIGGPPCQGFSIAGKRNIHDERNKLYLSFVSLVGALKPQAFVMENVPNILSMGKGAVARNIISDFEELGYTVKVETLLASDFGVPQNRRRTFFIGIRDYKAFDFRILQKSNPVVNSWEAISDLPEVSLDEGSPYPISPLSEYQEKIRSNSKGVFNHTTTNHTSRTKTIISLVPDGGNYKDLPIELQNIRNVNIAWTRMSSKRPSFTIDTGHNHLFHYEYNRVPTARESARLQSFPDSFVFLGGKMSQLKQIGNAVPPLLAKSIALALYDYII